MFKLFIMYMCTLFVFSIVHVCKYYFGINVCVKDVHVTDNMRTPIPLKYVCSRNVHFPKYERLCTFTPLLIPHD